jgi:crossover junction endodeoxyribonuclease RuvC
MAEGASRGVSVMEYSPSQIKAAVAGDGRADKLQMQEMVRTLLNLSALPTPADAADAAAVALCHLAHDPAGRMAKTVGR